MPSTSDDIHKVILLAEPY